MTNNSFEHVIEKYRYYIFSLLTGLVAFSTWITNPILDSNFLFHEGEYVGLLWNMRSFYSGEIQFPLLIHGAMDYLPSIVASFIYGDDHIIVGTRAINTIIAWLCWVLFFDLCYSLISKTNTRVFWLIIITAIFFIITPRFNSFALIVQHSFLGPRDIFIITTVWCFTQYTVAISTIRQRIFLIVGTFSAVTAIVWSYDRGIMALAFLAIMFIGVIKNKEKLNATLLFVTACISLVLIQYSNIFGSLSDNANNIFYWAKNSKEVFGIGFGGLDLIGLIITILVALFCTATIVLAVINAPAKTEKNLFIVIGLIVIQILLLKTILNRPGMPRLIWAIWPSILLLLYFASRRFAVNLAMPKFSFSATKPTYIAYKLYAFTFIFLILMVNTAVSPVWYGSFIKNILKPKLDTEIVSTEVINLSVVISQYPDKCFFGWVNEGVIALMAKKRFCTQYPYATYVSKADEIKLLQQIKSDSPNAIVYDITGNSMANIDGRSMESRLPIVNKFIQDNYPNRQQVGRYLVLSK